MKSLFLTLIAMPYLTTGRRLFAFNQSLVISRKYDQETIAAMIEEAIAHDRQTLTMERAWMRSKEMPNTRGNAFRLSRQIERLLTNIFSRLKGNIETLDISDPTVEASKMILGQVYPSGVAAISNLPFEEQFAHVGAIIARFDSDLKDATESTDVARLVQRLTSLSEAFGIELEKPGDKEIDFDELVAARREGNINLRKVVCVILALLREDEGIAGAVIKPILFQVNRVQQARKGRNPPADVDPDTGQELEPLSEELEDTPPLTEG